MLWVVTTHLVSGFADYQKSIYGMTGSAHRLTVTPDPDGQFNPSQNSVSINRALLSLVAQTRTTIIFDAQGGDGPRLGLYDPDGKYSSMRITSGRPFSQADFGASQALALVNSRSYSAEKPSAQNKFSAEVIGQYEAASVPFDADYIYNLFTQKNLHGFYYVEAEDPELGARMAKLLSTNGYLVSLEKIAADPWSIILFNSLTFAYAAGLLIVFLNLSILSSAQASSDARKFRIHHRYGATPWAFTARKTVGVCVAAIGGTLVGIGVAVPVTKALGSLTASPNIEQFAMVVLLNSAAVTLLFSAAYMFRTRMEVR